LDYLSDFNSDVPVKSWPLAHEFEGYQRNEKCLESSHPEHLKKIQKPFVLCVGTIEVRKNGIALLKVWQRLLKELGDKTPQLVFAGKYGWKIDPFKKLLQEDVSLQQIVTIIPQATDADLAVLYQKCLFFVYPSLPKAGDCLLVKLPGLENIVLSRRLLRYRKYVVIWLIMLIPII